jgi:hypothetical protein
MKKQLFKICIIFRISTVLKIKSHNCAIVCSIVLHIFESAYSICIFAASFADPDFLDRIRILVLINYLSLIFLV